MYEILEFYKKNPNNLDIDGNNVNIINIDDIMFKDNINLSYNNKKNIDLDMKIYQNQIFIYLFFY